MRAGYLGQDPEVQLFGESAVDEISLSPAAAGA